MPYPRPRDEKPPQDAGRQLGRAVEIGSELTTHYPTVPQYKASLARSYLRLAETAQAADSPAKAEDNLTKAVGLQKSLAAEFPAVAAYRFFLAQSLDQLARIQIARHELPQAAGEPGSRNRRLETDPAVGARRAFSTRHIRHAIRRAGPSAQGIGRVVAGR